jgi:FkbM family methyltransferase
MLKEVFLGMNDIIFNRSQIIRLSKALLNKALGDNNHNMETNGELFWLRWILNFHKETEHKLIAFDVGANVGQWTNSLLDIADGIGILEKVAVHSFEPSSAALQNFSRKYKERVHIVNAGVSNVNKSTILYTTKDDAGTNSFYKRRTEGLGLSYEKTKTVQTTTIDMYCSEKDISHIDFLKADVEGHELAVMQGAANMLKQHAIDYIQFEYGGCWIDSRTLFLDMYDLVTSFGYVIGKILPKGIEFYNKYDQRLETFQMANFLACQPNHINHHFNTIKPWMV